MFLNKRWGSASLWVPILFFTSFLYIPLLLFLGSYFSFPNLFSILKDALYLKILSFTFRESFLSALITVILAIPGAYLIARTRFLGKRFFLSLSLISFIMPGMSVALGFVLLFGKSGFIHTLFGINIPILYTFWAIIFAHVFYNLALSVRIIGSQWEGFSETYEEEAKIQGATPFQIFYYIVFPYLLPSILSAFLITFIYSFMSFAIVLVLGGVRYVTLEVEIYMYLTKLINFKEAANLAWFQFIILLFLTYILFSLRTRYGFEYDQEERRLKRFPVWGYIYAVVVFLLIFLPMGSMFIGGFWDFVNHKLTFLWFANIFSRGFNSYIGTNLFLPILNTFIYAFYSVVLVFFLVITGSFYIIYGKRYKGFYSTIFASSLFISPITLGFSYIYIKNWVNFPSRWGIVLAHTLIILPIAMQIFFEGRESLLNSLREAAFIDGASVMRTFVYIELPMLIPYLITSLSVSFAISMGEVGATLLLYDIPQNMTIPVAMVRLLSARRIGEARAYSTLLFISVFLLFLFIDFFLKKASKPAD